MDNRLKKANHDIGKYGSWLERIYLVHIWDDTGEPSVLGVSMLMRDSDELHIAWYLSYLCLFYDLWYLAGCLSAVLYRIIIDDLLLTLTGTLLHLFYIE